MPHDLTTPTGREELRRLLSLPDAETYTPAQFTMTRDEMRAALGRRFGVSKRCAGRVVTKETYVDVL